MTEQEVTPEIVNVLRSMDLFKGKDPDELTEWLGKAPFEGGAECVLRSFASPSDRNRNSWRHSLKAASSEK